MPDSIAEAPEYRLAVDTGGTFTDVVLASADGRFELAKAPTTDRASDALLQALEQLAELEGQEPERLLRSISTLVYGTTRATNAVVERETSKVAFLTTAGFPDILLLREGGRPGAFDYDSYPSPFVPRNRTYEIGGRIDASGACVEELDEAQVLEALAAVRAAGVEAIGVCLLWSVVNPEHEQRVGELIASELPGVPFTLSHQVNPILREYRRASSAVIDAALKPTMREHLRQLADDLEERGFQGDLLALTSFGGVWPIDRLRERPIYSVGSGPSVAPVGAIAFRDADPDLVDDRDLIVCDTGGTTFDVSLVRGSKLEFSAETWMGEPGISDMLGIVAADVHSIGAGGGSIAAVDAGGLLTVGPASAGALPGPACYGRGGTLPTVTDAALVLGYLEPSAFFGGRLTLDAEAAHAALERHVGAPLGLEVEAAADAVLAVAVENSVAAIKDITIARGHDPRQATIVAGGGAAGLSIAAIARALRCPRVIIPSLGSALSAAGAQLCDLVADFSANVYTETRSLEPATIDAVLDGLGAEAQEFFDSLRHLPRDGQRIAYSVDARYPGQSWELTVPVDRGPGRDASPGAALEEAFHREHLRVFRVEERGQYVECLRWRARAIAEPVKPPLLPFGPEAGNGGPREHVAWFRGVGRVPTSRHDAATLDTGVAVAGPAIVEQPTTTIVVPPAATLTRTAHGNFVVEIEMEVDSA